MLTDAYRDRKMRKFEYKVINRLVGVEKRLAYYRDEKESEIKRFFAYKGSIDVEKLNKAESELRRLNKEKEELEDELDSLKKPKYIHIELDESVDSYKEEIKKLQDRKMEIVSSIAKYNTLIETTTARFNELDTSIHESRVSMETSELVSLIDYLKSRISY